MPTDGTDVKVRKWMIEDWPRLGFGLAGLDWANLNTNLCTEYAFLISLIHCV